jgi:hypothetical protein
VEKINLPVIPSKGKLSLYASEDTAKPIGVEKLRVVVPTTDHQATLSYQETKSARRKRSSGLPQEVLAVLRSSPNLEPCRRFRRANFARFMRHLDQDKC